jgi:hypothetical protein
MGMVGEELFGRNAQIFSSREEEVGNAIHYA